MFEVRAKIISSLEKCFLDEKLDSKLEIKELSMLRNERLSFQLAYEAVSDLRVPARKWTLDVEGPLADKIKVSRVEQVPVTLTSWYWTVDDDYLRREPGLYPDLLLPMDLKEDGVTVVVGQLRTHYISIEDENGLEPGEYDVTLVLKWNDEEEIRNTVKIKVIDAFLPEMKLTHTEWFYTDCIAAYYQCEIFSERHWELIGNFMDAERKCGINTAFVSMFTPATDTKMGTERPTTQLVDVYLNNGEYSFGYERLDRYIAMARARGFNKFEMSHFFSQWGSNWPVKVMATVDGEYKKIFGGKPNALDGEYGVFLRAYLKDFLKHLKTLGIDEKNCFFHLLDEPKPDDLEGYRAGKNMIADLLEGYTTIDAVATYDSYRKAEIQTPVPESHNIEPFIENKVTPLWTYICQGQHTDVSNRYIAMPGQRTRMLGAQLFKFSIVGFLQWGFNYWYAKGARPNNPFIDPCCDYFGQAGDHFMVYPGPDGKALYTLHGEHTNEAFQDVRAMELLETKIGHDAVVAIIEEGCSEPMTFKKYPRTVEYMLAMRERINAAIEKAK